MIFFKLKSLGLTFSLLLTYQLLVSKTATTNSIDSYTISREVILATVAFQPNCPIIVKKIEVIGFSDGGSTVQFDIQNQGTRTIKSYDLAIIDSNGESIEIHEERFKLRPNEYKKSKNIVTPQQKATTAKNNEKVNLIDEMGGFLVFFVRKIEYTDGLVFDDENVVRLYKKLTDNRVNLIHKLEKNKKSPINK